MTQSYDFFLSHNRAEKDWCRQLTAALRAEGATVFFDEDSIPLGEDIVASIGNALSATRYVVLVLSPRSVKSRWVELEWASTLFADVEDASAKLIPLLIEECDIPFVIRRINHLHAISLSPKQAASRLVTLLQTSAMSVKQIKPLYPDAGMPLQFGSPQYVERSADEHLARVLETGHSAFLFGPRRIGKTSLLIREAYKARLRGMAMAFVDFQAYGIYDDKWLDYLGLDISQQVGRDWSQWKDDGLFGIQSMLREVANDHEDNGVFLAFDECDSLNRLGNARPFATMIRSTLNPLFGNVRCVCAGLVPPWLWHDDDELGSPWWNLMFPIRLTNFNIEQVRHLWQAADLPDQEMVPILHQVTGGQPTMIAYAAIETRRAGELQAVLDSAFSRKGNFMFIAKTLLRSANYLLGERADQICQEVLAAQPISGHERECLWLSGVILDPDDHPPLIAGDVMRRILETLAKGERA